MKQSANPLVTTLIGGMVFLLPLVVVLYVLGQGLALTTRVAQPLTSMLPDKSIGGIAFASIAALLLLLLLCFGAGLLARAAFGRALTDQFEARLQTVYPRYAVIKAMSQGLHGALGHRVLKPVLVTFDDHQLIAYDIERLDDGRAVLFLPGAPEPGRAVWCSSDQNVSRHWTSIQPRWPRRSSVWAKARRPCLIRSRPARAGSVAAQMRGLARQHEFQIGLAAICRRRGTNRRLGGGDFVRVNVVDGSVCEFEGSRKKPLAARGCLSNVQRPAVLLARHSSQRQSSDRVTAWYESA